MGILQECLCLLLSFIKLHQSDWGYSTNLILRWQRVSFHQKAVPYPLKSAFLDVKIKFTFVDMFEFIKIWPLLLGLQAFFYNSGIFFEFISGVKCKNFLSCPNVGQPDKVFLLPSDSD